MRSSNALLLLLLTVTPCFWRMLVTTDLLSAPGGNHLVITHKSLLRALLCTALGLPPRQFRAIDISNGAVCMVR
jgi:broad specificity phosphatase PhoE